MSLQDFLGKCSEILIIDFLAENIGFSYTISEISEQTGLSRTTIHAKLPELIMNNIVEVDGEAGPVKTYKLADNNLVNKIMEVIYLHSFMQAGEPLEEGEAIDIIKKKMDENPEYAESRYYKSMCDSGEISTLPINYGNNPLKEKTVTANNASSA